MSIGISVAAASLIGGGLAAAGGVGSALIGSSASKTAAQQQETEQQQALDFQKQVYNTNQSNLAPYLTGGSTSFSQLLAALNSGKFGPGSLGPAPTFTAPTGVTMQNDPAYQWQLHQGEQGIERGAAAAGGAFTGGTLKSLAGYNQQMANTAYQSVFNNALSGYGTQLQQYQANLSSQAQAFNQLLAPVQIGESAAVGAGSEGIQSGAQVGSTLTNLGSAAAAGTIGSASALSGGLQSATGAISSATTLPLYLQYLNGGGGGGQQQTWAPNDPTPGPPTLWQNGAPYQPSTAGTVDFSATGAPN